MQSAFWKIAALASVLSLGGYVVVEVHQRLPKSGGPATASQFKNLGEAEAATAPADATDAPLAVPASGPQTAFIDGEDAVPTPSGWGQPALGTTPESAADDTAAPWLGAQSEPQPAVEASASLEPAVDSVPWPAADAQADAAAPLQLEPQPLGAADNAADLPAWESDALVTADAAQFGAEETGVMQVDAVQPAPRERGPGAAPPTQPMELTFGSEPETTGSESASFDPSFAASPEFESAATVAETADSDVTEEFGPAVTATANVADSATAEPAEWTFDTAPPAEPAPIPAARERPAPIAFDYANAAPPEQSPPADEAATLDFGAPAETSDVVATDAAPVESTDATFDPFPAQAEPTPAFDAGTEAAPTTSFDPFMSEAPAAGDVAEDQPAAVEPAQPIAEIPLGQPSRSLFLDDEDAPRSREPRAQFNLEPLSTASPAPATTYNALIGDATLDGESPAGPQQPKLTVEKVAPQEATVGEPLVYAIKVRNAGDTAARQVTIEDRIPRGTTLEGTIPQAELTSDRKLLWSLGTMEPGEEQLIRIRVIPTESGEIGSVATVRFVAEVAAATVITTPVLAMDCMGPQEMSVGERKAFTFSLHNQGETDARAVYLRSILPEGLDHPGGRDIEYDVGVLKAGESRSIELYLTASQPGPLSIQSYANVGSKTYAQKTGEVSVVASRLLIQRQGPNKRFIGRPAEYTTTVTNRSQAALERITLVEQLPQALELAGVPASGQFDANRRTITWRIPRLEAGESLAFDTRVVAQAAGQMESLVAASDAAGNRAELKSTLDIAGFSSLAVDFAHSGRPVAVGEQVAMRLTVKNNGTGPAQDVMTTFEIPSHLEFVNAEGPVEYRQQGNTVQFASLESIEAKGEQTFDIVLTAAEPGVSRVSALLQTPDVPEPLQYDQAVVVETDEE